MAALRRPALARRLSVPVLVVVALCFAAPGAAAQGVTNPLAVVNADGSGLRSVGQLPFVPDPPGVLPAPKRVPWSYDNKEIAFVGPGSAISALSVDGGAQRRLTPGKG